MDANGIALLKRAYDLLVRAEIPEDDGEQWRDTCDEVLNSIEEYLSNARV